MGEKQTYVGWVPKDIYKKVFEKDEAYSSYPTKRNKLEDKWVFNGPFFVLRGKKTDWCEPEYPPHKIKITVEWL